MSNVFVNNLTGGKVKYLGENGDNVIVTCEMNERVHISKQYFSARYVPETEYNGAILDKLKTTKKNSGDNGDGDF